MKDKEVQELLDAIPRETVGGGAKRNLFIVSLAGKVDTITYDGPTAYRRWREFVHTRPDMESSLEDNSGCVATREPEGDDSPTPTKLITIDDTPEEIRRAIF